METEQQFQYLYKYFALKVLLLSSIISIKYSVIASEIESIWNLNIIMNIIADNQDPKKPIKKCHKSTKDQAMEPSKISKLLQLLHNIICKKN